MTSKDSKKTSRPSSAAAGTSGSGRVSRPHSASREDDEEVGGYFSEEAGPSGSQPPEGLTQEQVRTWELTKRNPLGKALIDFLHDQINIAEKTGIRETNSNLHDFCNAFQNNLLLQDQNWEEKALAIENKLIQRDLNSHLLNQNFKLPENFSAVPTIKTPGQKAECLRVFPTRGPKFNGSDSPNVLEFLSMMRSAQEQCHLSVKEFEDMLLHCTTGPAHMLLMDWLDHGETIESIFHNFMLHYDRRLSPEDARLQLLTYKAPKMAPLQKVESKIMNLATRASATLPPGASRAANFNNEAISALIRCMPPSSAVTIQNTYHSLSAKLGRSCTFTELTRALNMFRHGIDADIRLNGIDSNNRREMGQRNAFKKPTGSYNTTRKIRKPVTYSIQTKQDTSVRNRTSPKAHTFENTGRQGFNMRGNAHNHKHQYKGMKGKDNKGYRNNDTRKNNFGFRKPHYNKQEEYCSLCGNTDHKAADGCPYMVADNGKTLKIIPSQSNCSACPSHISPRLNHPVQVCPYRVGGPFNGSA